MPLTGYISLQEIILLKSHFPSTTECQVRYTKSKICSPGILLPYLPAPVPPTATQLRADRGPGKLALTHTPGHTP